MTELGITRPGEPPPAPPPPKSLAAKLAEVYLSIGRVPKTGKHPTQGWSFATDADIADMIRGALGLRGIILEAEIVEHSEAQIGATKSGAPMVRHTVRMMFVLTDGTERRAHYWVGQADDATDKGLPKAITFARKTFLLATFLMSTGDPADEPDAHDGAGQVVAPSKRASRWAALCAIGLPEPEVIRVMRSCGLESSAALEDDLNYAQAESAVAAAYAALGKEEA